MRRGRASFRLRGGRRGGHQFRALGDFLISSMAVNQLGWGGGRRGEGEATAKYFGCQGPGEDAGLYVPEILQEIGQLSCTCWLGTPPHPHPPSHWEETCTWKRPDPGPGDRAPPSLPCPAL